MKELAAIKKIMSCLYFILSEEPQRNNTFNSLQELYEKLEHQLQKSVKSHNPTLIKNEVLENFTPAIKWMKDREVILYDANDIQSPIFVIKEKLIKNIANI
jgi:hypothetical protein